MYKRPWNDIDIHQKSKLLVCIPMQWVFYVDIMVRDIISKKKNVFTMYYILVMFGFGLCMKCLIIDVKYKLVGKRFEVLVNCTEASDQLGLSGRLYLHVTEESLDAEQCDTLETLHSWKYGHIQRFGYNKSSNDFLMVTGRRKKFGHGVFDFHVLGDPRKIIDSLQNKQGCSLKLADGAKRISNMI